MNEHEKFMSDFRLKMKEFDEGLDSARAISREAIYKFVFLSASIVGFSATLQSIDSLSLKTDPQLLKLSWMLFVFTIVVGPTINFLESRVKYVITWRSLQHQDHEWKSHLSLWRIVQAVGVLLYSLMISPRSLLLCRIYKDTKLKRVRAQQNSFVIAAINTFINLALLLEVVFIILFISSLIALVRSVNL